MKGVRHYLIRWKGYTEESDTWEPEDTLDCENLINDYKKKGKTKKVGKKKSVGKDDDDQNTWDENEDFEVHTRFNLNTKFNSHCFTGRSHYRRLLPQERQTRLPSLLERLPVLSELLGARRQHGLQGFDREIHGEGERGATVRGALPNRWVYANVVILLLLLQAKESKLRVNPKPVNRLEFSMHEKSRRLSKRRSGKDR